MYKFKFADIGEGLHEGVVAEIYKKEGDTVAEGDSLFSVETDKVTSDIPAPTDGKVVKVYMSTGDTIHVGDVIYDIDDGSGDSAPVEEAKPEVKEEVVEEPAEESAASVVGDIKVSNNLFSSDMFKKLDPNARVIQKPSMDGINVASPVPKVVSQPANDKIDISKFEPIGDGELVDAVVIGAGPGGYTAGEFLAKNGYKTIVVEKEAAGGVCLNVGCIPTKTLLKSAQLASSFKHASDYGIDVDFKEIKYNWEKMQDRKTRVADTLSRGVEMLLSNAKATYVKGDADIIDRWNVKVGDKVYTTKIIVVATGSSAIVIPIKGVDEGIAKGAIIDSTGALSLSKIPKSLVVVGGGVIGVEFAVLYAELGTKVTILEGGPSVLGPMDGEVKKITTDILKNMDIEIITNVMVEGWEDGTTMYKTKDGEVKGVKSEKMLLSVGRRPNNMDIDKKAGVKLGKIGEILTNDINMQTNVENIFAIGDVVGRLMLAHVAYKHAHVLVNAIIGIETTLNYNHMPASVYAYPEISMIGKTEEQLKEEGADYISSVWQNQYVGKALADGDTTGFTKLLVDKKTGAILGAHLINRTSSDMIAEVATVMELEGTVYEIANTVHPHPSTSEGIYEAAVHAVYKLRALKANQ